MNRSAELEHCEGCGASLHRHCGKRTLCNDCTPRRPPRPHDVRAQALERTRVLRAQGFSEKEIARALGVSVQTVRARLKRAREQGSAVQRGPR